MSVDAQAAHVLVAPTQAGARVAPIDETGNPGDGAVSVDDWAFGGAQFAAAPGEHGQVIRVLQVRAPGEVAMMQSACQVCC
jgi:hypothetical protein